jgi:hypothetical protein
MVGWVMAMAGARAGLGLGAITCLVVALGGLLTLRRIRGRGVKAGTGVALSA